jgi:hypothetical protein
MNEADVSRLGEKYGARYAIRPDAFPLEFPVALQADGFVAYELP